MKKEKTYEILCHETYEHLCGVRASSPQEALRRAFGGIRIAFHRFWVSFPGGSRRYYLSSDGQGGVDIVPAVHTDWHSGSSWSGFSNDNPWLQLLRLRAARQGRTFVENRIRSRAPVGAMIEARFTHESIMGHLAADPLARFEVTVRGRRFVATRHEITEALRDGSARATDGLLDVDDARIAQWEGRRALEGEKRAALPDRSASAPCPDCGAAVERVDGEIRTSYPPQWAMRCTRCEWTGFRLAGKDGE